MENTICYPIKYRKLIEPQSQAIKFANQYSIQVTVKTTGHNYAGASMGNLPKSHAKFLGITKPDHLLIFSGK